MNKEELLLTPDRIWRLKERIRKEGIRNGIQPTNNALLTEAQECVQHLEWNQYLCQAQLDKVTKAQEDALLRYADGEISFERLVEEMGHNFHVLFSAFDKYRAKIMLG